MKVLVMLKVRMLSLLTIWWILQEHLTKAADLMLKWSNKCSCLLYPWYFIGYGLRKIDNSSISELVITDTIPKDHNSQ